MRHSDGSSYSFEDGYFGYCGAFGVHCSLTEHGLPCAAAECLFPNCGDEDHDDGVTFHTYDDENTLVTNYTDGRTVFSGDADDLTLATNYTDGRTVFSGDADDLRSLFDESVMTFASRHSVGSTRHSIVNKGGVGDKITKRLNFFSGGANDVLSLSSQFAMSRQYPESARYSSVRRDGAGDRITKRLQTIDERNKALGMEPMTTGLSCLPATAADQDDASTVLFTKIAPLPTVEEEEETLTLTATAPTMRFGEASAISENGSSTTIPCSNTMFSSRTAKSSKSTKTEKTSSSGKSFPGALMVARAGTKLRSAKPRLGNTKQRKDATGIIGANEKCVEVIDLDRRDDRADERDQSTSKVSNLVSSEIDKRESFAEFGEDNTNSENGTMTTVKTAAGAMGSALTVLNIKKIKARHDAVKRANAIEAEARKFSDRKLCFIKARANYLFVVTILFL